MFTEIGIENFKCFGKMQRIPLKPITLLYGPNSSGKSSLVQSFLLLKQTLEESGDDSIILLPKGNLVDLGGYQEFINNHNIRKEFSLSLSFKHSWASIEIADSSLEFTFSQDKSGEILVSAIKAIDSHQTDPIMECKNIWRIPSLKKAVLKRKNKFEQNGDDSPAAIEKWLFALKKSVLVIEYINTAHWVMKYVWDTWAEDTTNYCKYIEEIKNDINRLEEHIIKKNEELDREFKKIADDLNHLEEREREDKNEKLTLRRTKVKQLKKILKSLDAVRRSLTHRSYEDIRKSRKFFVSNRMISLSNCFPKDKSDLSGEEASLFQNIPFFVELGKPSIKTNEIYEGLNPVYYYFPIVLSHLKEYLRRIIYIGPLREYPERVYSYSGNIPSNVGKSGKYTPDILLKRPDLVDKVNEWFNKFEIGYMLQVSMLKKNLFALSLTDGRTKCEVTPKDVGFGIGQLLPILVQGVLSENKIIVVEQPEIHVHPRLQAELGSFFAAVAGRTRTVLSDLYDFESEKYGNQFIIETHSESLILRLQKLIRKGELSKEDVAVIYCDKTPDGTVATELRLNDKGEFIDPWPHGFFEESFKEMFGD